MRIGIQDDAVDIEHPAFGGRIELSGASFSYRRALITLADGDSDPNDLDDCKASEPCRVYLVDSGGNRSRLEELARTVLEDQGLPPENDKWFLYDIASDGFGWSELPALGQSDPSDGAQHGTGVASVAAREAPTAVIVPMATNFEDLIALENQRFRRPGPLGDATIHSSRIPPSNSTTPRN